MPTRIAVVNRVVIAVAIQVQAVDGFGVQVGSIIGRNESAPFGGVIPSVAIIQTGIIVVVIAAITNRVGIGNGCVGGAGSDGAIAESIIEVPCYHSAVGVDDRLHIAQQIPLEVIAGRNAAGGMLHANDGTFVVQEYDPFGYSAGSVNGFADFLRNQTACVVIVILLVVGRNLAGLHGVQPGGACQIRVGLCYPLAESVIAVSVVRGAAGQGTAGQPGQLTLAPCGGHAVITGGTAHGVVGNAATIILPPSPSAVKKKPPRP